MCGERAEGVQIERLAVCFTVGFLSRVSGIGRTRGGRK